VVCQVERRIMYVYPRGIILRRSKNSKPDHSDNDSLEYSYNIERTVRSVKIFRFHAFHGEYVGKSWRRWLRPLGKYMSLASLSE
jgi:hypothetical protein